MELTEENIRKIWPEVLKSIETASVRMSLKDADISTVQGNTIHLAFASAFHKDKVCSQSSSHHIEDILTKLCKKPMRIECTLQSGNAAHIEKDDDVNLAEAASEVF